MSKLRIAVIAMSLSFFGSSTAASALDLTGTWTGVETCTSFLAGALVKNKTDVVVLITQTGSDLNWSQDTGTLFLGSANGYAFADAVDSLKGEAGIITCGSNEIYSVAWRLKAKTKADGGGLLKGTEIGAGSGGVGTCKVALKRTTQDNPDVAGCL